MKIIFRLFTYLTILSWWGEGGTTRFRPNGHLRSSSCSDVLKTESYSRPEFYSYSITILSLCLYIKEANFNIYYFCVIRTWASCNLLVLVCMCSECVQPAVVSQLARGLRLNALYEVDQHYNILQLHVLWECCHFHWLEQWNWNSPRNVAARLPVGCAEMQLFNANIVKITSFPSGNLY